MNCSMIHWPEIIPKLTHWWFFCQRIYFQYLVYVMVLCFNFNYLFYWSLLLLPDIFYCCDTKKISAILYDSVMSNWLWRNNISSECVHIVSHLYFIFCLYFNSFCIYFQANIDWSKILKYRKQCFGCFFLVAKLRPEKKVLFLLPARKKIVK